MKIHPLWAFAAIVAGSVLVYQIASDGESGEGPGPGLDPTPLTTEGASAGGLSEHRSSDLPPAPATEIRASVTGVVQDHLGTPRAGERIWILRPGERHPQVFGHAQDLRTVESDESGKFQFDLGPESDWHFSIGAIGEAEELTEVRRFGDGEQAELEIVLGGAAHLNVIVTADAGVETAIQPARIEMQRKTQAGDDRLIQFGAPPKPGFGLDPDAKPKPPEPWATSSALALRLDEEVLFARLNLGDTYRVAVVLGDRTALSNKNIVLASGEDQVARCQLRELDGTLTLDVALGAAAGEGGRQPGFHWAP